MLFIHNHQASWIRNQMENEPMNRLDVPVPQEASRKRKKRNKKNSNHNTNTYHYNNDYPNTMRHTHGLRSRSESENNYGNDTMDFWEWNGTEWFNKKTKTDQISKNTEQVNFELLHIHPVRSDKKCIFYISG